MMTTASQMLRDDQRLRSLHRATKKRRKRFLDKQKQLEDEEMRRRNEALQRRRKQRNHNTSHRRDINRKRHHAQPPKSKTSPVRVQRRVIPQMEPNPRTSPSYIVPVSDQMATPSLSPMTKPKRHRVPKRLKPVNHSIKHTDIDMTKHEDLKREEELDYFEQEAAISDQQSVAELEQFEKRHFGVQQSMDQKPRCHLKHSQEYREHQLADNKENDNQNAVPPPPPPLQRNGGYQALFRQKMDYNKGSHRILRSVNNNNNERDYKSLFSINDVDMKTPEENDAVSINPKDSIECGKMSFSTVYDSNLYPLQSVYEHPHPQPVPPTKDVHHSKISNPKQPSQPRVHRQSKGSRVAKSKIPEPAKRLKACLENIDHKNYGIKLPRLTRSILQEKDRLDSRSRTRSKHRPFGTLSQKPPSIRSPLKSVLSAPTWNGIHRGNLKESKIKNSTNSIGYNMAVGRKRKTTTMIDDFFKESEEFNVDCSSNINTNSIRKSNHTLFLPQIKRPRAKTKVGGRYSSNHDTAHSVMADLDIIRKEEQLKQSLDRLNNRLSTLNENNKSTINENEYQYPMTMTMKGQRSRNRVSSHRHAMYPNYIGDGKIANIPRKLKTKKSPTFKSSRQRRRWKG